MKHTAVTIVAWAFLGLIAFWTLGPLAFRPRIGPPQLERFGAFFMLGALFFWSYRRPSLVAFGLVAVAVALEIGQLFVPGRDARVADAIAKSAGAVVGVFATWAAVAFQERRRASGKGPWRVEGLDP